MADLVNIINFDGIVAMGIVLLTMIMTIFFYIKARRWILITISFLFSLIVSIASFEYAMPLTPWVQIMSILVNSIIFILTSIEAFNRK